jgi:hypothetical protein
MDLAAVLIYKAALSPSDRHAVEEYLFEMYIAPEPSTAILLVVGGGLLLRRRRAA